IFQIVKDIGADAFEAVEAIEFGVALRLFDRRLRGVDAGDARDASAGMDPKLAHITKGVEHLSEREPACRLGVEALVQEKPCLLSFQWLERKCLPAELEAVFLRCFAVDRLSD